MCALGRWVEGRDVAVSDSREVTRLGNDSHCTSVHKKPNRQVDDVLKNEAPASSAVPSDLNKYSSRITQPKSQGASQAMLYGTGLTPDDMNKPQVGISSVWWEGNTCNMHLNDLALEVKLGVEDAGLVGFRFNTIGVSDGISMGTDGMSYSLQSRDLIADSIETVMSAQWYDANISLPGCDKNMPGTIMAMARLNRPSLMIYGGTIRAGTSSAGEKLDIVSAFQSYGGFAAGLIEEAERADIVKNSCPGPGACGGMYTANTMASAIEALGMSLPYSSSTPAEDPLKKVECRLAGRYLLELMKRDIKPRDIMTKASFENAIVLVMATGGSTNAVLHLIAMANACGIELGLDDFQRISDKVPFIADLKPSGKYVMEDLHKVRICRSRWWRCWCSVWCNGYGSAVRAGWLRNPSGLENTRRRRRDVGVKKAKLYSSRFSVREGEVPKGQKRRGCQKRAALILP